MMYPSAVWVGNHFFVFFSRTPGRHSLGFTAARTITDINPCVLVEDVFDFFYLRGAEFRKFQVHLSFGRVGRVLVDGQRGVLRLRTGRVSHCKHLRAVRPRGVTAKKKRNKTRETEKKIIKTV